MLLALAGLVVPGCGRERSRGPEDTARPAAADSAATAPAAAPESIRYEARVLGGDAELRALRDSLGAAGFAALLAVNRIDLAHVRTGDTLVVPVPADSFEACSPFPAHIAGLDSLPRLFLVSNRVQAWAAYAAGTRVRWGPCCTGRATKRTPVGLYHTNWKLPERYSTIDGSWLLRWYVNLHSTEGISFHVYELPGRPASHSCVRLGEDDARWIYDWCETWTLSDRRHVAREGTPTLVLDTYAYGMRRPWRALPADPRACDVPDSLIASALAAAHLPPPAASASAPADSLASADSLAPADTLASTAR